MATTNPTTFNIIFLLAEKSVLIKDAGRHCLHQANEHTKVVHHMKSTVEQKVTHNATLSTVFTLLSSTSQVLHMLYAILNLSSFVVTGCNLVNKFSNATKYEKSHHQFMTYGR